MTYRKTTPNIPSRYLLDIIVVTSNVLQYVLHNLIFN